MYCKICGYQLDEKSIVCPVCGNLVDSAEGYNASYENQMMSAMFNSTESTDINTGFDDDFENGVSQKNEYNNQNKKKNSHGGRGKMKVALVLVCTFLLAVAGVVYMFVFKPSHNEDEVKTCHKELEITESEGVRYISDESYIMEPDEEDIVSYNDINYVDGELILHAVYGTERNAVINLVENYNGEIVGEIAATYTYQVRFDGKYEYDDLNKLLNELEKNEIISWVSLDTVFETESDYYPESDSKWSDEWDDGYASGLNWGVEAIYAPKAWEYIDEMDYVNVGVYDCCFYEHEDLTYSGLYFNDTKACRADPSTHGTHVSGIIGAGFDNGTGISGVAPFTNLYCYSCSKSSNDKKDFIMRYEAVLEELLIEDDCKVINISLNTGRERGFAASMGYKEAIDSIKMDANEIGRYLEGIINNSKDDFVICVAAGNTNNINFIYDSSADYKYRKAKHSDDSDAYLSGNVQAKYNNFLSAIEIESVKNHIIVVGSCGNNKDGTYHYSSFSNIGGRVDVVAPGEYIYSTIDNNEYDNLSGTSMATPHISGVAAMLFAIDDSLTGEDVKSIIINTASTDVEDCNYKMVNAYLAVSSAKDDVLTVVLDDEDEKATQIPDDAYELNGHYYYVYTGTCETWEEAESFCESKGGYLAVINDERENNFVFDMMKELGYDNAYFGYSDAESEGVWKWVNGEASNYENWSNGEPNNENGNENYAMFYHSSPDYTWNDGNFNHGTVGDEATFICEWETESSDAISIQDLTDCYWEQNIQCPSIFEFREDGTCYRYGYEPSDDPYEAIANGNYYSCDLIYYYNIDGDKLILTYVDSDESIVLHYVNKSYDIEWDVGLSEPLSEIGDTEYFFYETEWDKSDPFSNAMYFKHGKLRD